MKKAFKLLRKRREIPSLVRFLDKQEMNEKSLRKALGCPSLVPLLSQARKEQFVDLIKTIDEPEFV